MPAGNFSNPPGNVYNVFFRFEVIVQKIAVDMCSLCIFPTMVRQEWVIKAGVDFVDNSLLAALEVIREHGLEKEFVSNLLGKVNAEIDKNRLLSAYLHDIYIFTDGSMKSDRGGCGCVIYLKDKVIKTNRSIIGSITSHHAEYEAVLFAVMKLQELNITDKKVIFFTDSKSVVEQLSGRAKCKGNRAGFYVVNILCTLTSLNIEAIFSYTPRSYNSEAHHLANKARGAQIIEEIY
jgi:ribonuclease HI